MFEKKEGGLTPAETETIVGESVKLKGNLKSDSNIKIAGSLQGEIKTKGDIEIGKSAKINAKIQAQNLKVAGTINGNIEIKEQLEITETGKVFGDLTTNILVIQPGAIFSGKSTMQEQPLAKEEEPIPEYELEESKKGEEEKK
jgi:cytoskeletal protein CcmA (bactofilin family)